MFAFISHLCKIVTFIAKTHWDRKLSNDGSLTGASVADYSTTMSTMVFDKNVKSFSHSIHARASSSGIQFCGTVANLASSNLASPKRQKQLHFLLLAYHFVPILKVVVSVFVAKIPVH